MRALKSTVMPGGLTAAWLHARRALGRWSATALCALVALACGGGSESTAPVAPTAATITSLSPASVSAGSGSFTLTVDGSGFVAASVVSLGGSLLSMSFVPPGTDAAVTVDKRSQ